LFVVFGPHSLSGVFPSSSRIFEESRKKKSVAIVDSAFDSADCREYLSNIRSLVRFSGPNWKPGMTVVGQFESQPRQCRFWEIEDIVKVVEDWEASSEPS
jgi:hypothetical protein